MIISLGLSRKKIVAVLLLGISYIAIQAETGKRASKTRGNDEANSKLKLSKALKTRKENLKPRKPNFGAIKLIQGNLQKSHTGQIELNKRIGTLNREGGPFVCLVQEPYTNSSNRGYNGSDHNYITFNRKTEKTTVSRVWLWRKEDWGTFKQEMQKLQYKMP